MLATVVFVVRGLSSWFLFVQRRVSVCKKRTLSQLASTSATVGIFNSFVFLTSPPPQPSIDACFSVSDVCLCSTIIIVVTISLHSIYSINNADANHMFTHVLRSAWLLLLLRTPVALLQALINFVSKICHNNYCK